MKKIVFATLALIALPAAAETPDQVATRYHLAGELLVAKGDRILLDKGYGTIDPSGGPAHKPGERWRLASITKQLVATAIVARYPLADLDRPIAPTLREPRLGTLTMRQLLTHHSGLANPDDTPPNAAGVPAYYAKRPRDADFCLSRQAKPGSAFRYNNCDYILAAFALPGDLPIDLAPGITPGDQGDLGVPGFVGGRPEPRFDLWSYATAGGYVGTARALFDFDRALMTGKLLSPGKRDELWKPEGNGSYQALGQWVFPGRLKGCPRPKRIVQRDGEIFGVQARNFILPDDDIAVIVFTNRSADDFAMGEVWQGKGFVYDLLSAAAC